MKFILILLFLVPAVTLAQDAGYQGIDLQAPFGGLSRVTNLGEYIAGVYKYSIVIGGILAGVMITIGGLKWLTAAGNAPAIESAKKTITGAIVGLILIFSSYVILNTINPQLVKLRVPAIRTVQREELRISIIRSALPTCRGRTREGCNIPGCTWSETDNECIIVLASQCDNLNTRVLCEAQAPGCGWLANQNKCVAAAANSEPLIQQRIEENSRDCESKNTEQECSQIQGCVWDGQRNKCNATLERATGLTLCQPREPRCPSGQKCIRQEDPLGGAPFAICSNGTPGAACNENNDCNAGLRCGGSVCE